MSRKSHNLSWIYWSFSREFIFLNVNQRNITRVCTLYLREFLPKHQCKHFENLHLGRRNSKIKLLTFFCSYVAINWLIMSFFNFFLVLREENPPFSPFESTTEHIPTSWKIDAQSNAQLILEIRISKSCEGLKTD